MKNLFAIPLLAVLLGLTAQPPAPRQLAPAAAGVVIIDSSKQVITLPGGWFDLAEPIVIRDRVGVIIRGDGTTQVNYTGPKNRGVFELINCKRVQFQGIAEIRGNGSDVGVMIRGEDGSAISSIDNVIQGPIHILGSKVAVQIGDGTRKSVSENKLNDCELSGTDAGLRINSGNGQNIYTTRLRITLTPIGIDLIRGGLHDRDSLYAANEIDISVGDPNNVLIIDGAYSEASGNFLVTKADQSPNPGSCTLIGCHVAGEKPCKGQEWRGPCVVRWALPGPFNVIGGEFTGRFLVGGAHNTPANFVGTIFKTRDPFGRINDTGTFLTAGCQFRDDVAIKTEPVTRLEFAGENGLSVGVLSWGPQETRGIRLGTMRGPSDQWSGAIKFDGGGVVGGGNKQPVYWPAVKE